MLKALGIIFLAIIGFSVFGSLISRNSSPGTSISRPTVTRTATTAPVVRKPTWRAVSAKSKIDDSTNVWLSLTSNDPIVGSYGEVGPIEMNIRCMENTTSVFFQFAGSFMADIQGFGDVTYRIDDNKAQKRGLTESTDHMALGLWNGGSAIPFVKAMFGGSAMFLRAVPYSESPVEGEFNIAGLEEATKPLRTACNW